MVMTGIEKGIANVLSVNISKRGGIVTKTIIYKCEDRDGKMIRVEGIIREEHFLPSYTQL